MKYVCEPNLCNGCNACADMCKKHAITITDTLSEMNAIIDNDKCTHCNLCTKICPRCDGLPKYVHPISWYQGWANDAATRKLSASGGIAAAVMKSFIEDGGVVATCSFSNGEFCYTIVETTEEIFNCVGSKYVKSTPRGIYNEVIKRLQEGLKVLFLGLPCHVAAVKNVVTPHFLDKLYTIDLICHGSPSPKLIEKYLQEHGIALQELKSVEFRIKDGFQPKDRHKPIVRPGITDRYLYTFLNRINFTENCYHCSYARLERISDLTIGDSWGSELDEHEQRKGISLILCQNEKGEELLKKSNIALFKVDLENAIRNNMQLQGPAQIPENRDLFFDLMRKNMPYEKAVFKINPIMCIKQSIKRILLSLKKNKGKGIVYCISVNKKE